MAETIPFRPPSGRLGVGMSARRRARPRGLGYSRTMVRDSGVSPIGEAMVWVSRIMAIGLTMFLPGVGGGWLDARLGTTFLGPLGFTAGLGLAVLALVRLQNRNQRPPK